MELTAMEAWAAAALLLAAWIGAVRAAVAWTKDARLLSPAATPPLSKPVLALGLLAWAGLTVAASCAAAARWPAGVLAISVLGCFPAWLAFGQLYRNTVGSLDHGLSLAVMNTTVNFLAIVHAAVCERVEPWMQGGTCLASVMLLASYARLLSTRPESRDVDLQRFCTLSSDPSPLHSDVLGSALAERKSGGDIRQCKWCGFYKLDRMHHCRSCRTCIVEMDHHCPWVLSCVGFHNGKFFLLSLLYFVVWIFIVDMNLSREVFLQSSMPSGVAWSVSIKFALLLGFLLGILTASFLCFHIYLRALNNLTTIEFCEKKFSSSENHISPYSMGLWRNLEHMLGPRAFLWLFPVDPPRSFASAPMLKSYDCQAEMRMLADAIPSSIDICFDLAVIVSFWLQGLHVFFAVAVGIFFAAGAVNFTILRLFGQMSWWPGLILCLTQTKVMVATWGALRKGRPTKLVAWTVIVEVFTESVPQIMLALYSQLLVGASTSPLVLASMLWSMFATARTVCRLDTFADAAGHRSMALTFAEVAFRVLSLVWFGALMRPEGVSIHKNVSFWLPGMIMLDFCMMLGFCSGFAKLGKLSGFYAVVLVLVSPPLFTKAFTPRLHCLYRLWRLAEVVVMVLACAWAAAQSHPGEPFWHLWGRVQGHLAYFILLCTSGVAWAGALIYELFRQPASGYDTLLEGENTAPVKVLQATAARDVLGIMLNGKEAAEVDGWQLVERREAAAHKDSGRSLSFPAACAPLALAAAFDDAGCLRALLAARADASIEVPEVCLDGGGSLRRATPLAIAAWQGSLDAVRVLVAAGADAAAAAALDRDTEIVGRSCVGEAEKTLTPLGLAALSRSEIERKAEEAERELGRLQLRMAAAALSPAFQESMLEPRRRSLAIMQEDVARLAAIEALLRGPSGP